MEFFEGDNIGGLSNIEIIEHFNVRSLVPVELVEGKVFTEVPFKNESGQFKIKEEDTDNGTVYAYSGRFFLHSMRNEVDSGMAKFIGQVSVMRLTDMNGRKYIIGAPGKPVTISKNGDTGQRYTNENGTEFSFQVAQMESAITS
jgi:hypothetical protein